MTHLLRRSFAPRGHRAERVLLYVVLLARAPGGTGRFLWLIVAIFVAACAYFDVRAVRGAYKRGRLTAYRQARA